MKMTRVVLSMVALVFLAGGRVAAEDLSGGMSVETESPVGIQELVYARPFTLKTPYRSDWRKERPLVQSGWVVVLRVDPALVAPKATAMPVLYAGQQTVELVNIGYPSGYVVGIVPGDKDVKDVPFWFGEPGFPDQVDSSVIQRNRRLAASAGLAPARSVDTWRALDRGGRKLRVSTKDELLNSVAPLILEYSPDERELANILQGRPPGG